MIESDPEFYRKWIAILQNSAISPLSMGITGNTLHFYCGLTKLGEMNTSLFHRLSVHEIMNLIGVPRNENII